MAEASGMIPAFEDIVLRHSTDAALLLHPTGGVVYVSPACEHVTGLPSKHFMGMLAADWVHPDDVAAAIEQRRIADEDGHSGPTLIRGRHGDGGYHWYEAEWWHVATNHTVLHVRDVQFQEVAISTTVKELALLTAALEHSGVVAFSVDGSGRMHLLAGTMALLGWPAGTPTPSTWWPLVHPEDHRAVSALLQNAKGSVECSVADGHGGWQARRLQAADLRRDPRAGTTLVYVSPRLN